MGLSPCGSRPGTIWCTMTKAQKMAAIDRRLAEYADNLAAVQESEIPGGFDQLVKEALVTTLRAKFERIFDQPE